MSSFLVFDIETIPDIEGGRKLHDLRDLDDADVVELLQQKRRQEVGHEFLRPYLQRVCAISAVLRRGQQVKVWSLGSIESSEAEIIQRFFDGIERFTPTLISWNGSGFDLPVLHYRALLHKIRCPRYWEMGRDDPAFKFNNYLSRFHWRHIDVMDVLSGYQARMTAPLDDIAVLLGLPGKMGMSGSHVWDSFQHGDIQGIRDYCETDVLNTWLVWLHFQLMRGEISHAQFEAECDLLEQYLQAEDQAHFNEFLQRWQRPASDLFPD